MVAGEACVAGHYGNVCAKADAKCKMLKYNNLQNINTGTFVPTPRILQEPWHFAMSIN
jgi:hypothetical protein